MFRSVKYSESAIASSSDSEIEPLDSNDSHSNRSGKHVQLLVDTEKSHDAEDRLPQFQKRPLSDTPIMSMWNSPSGSADSSADQTPVSSPHASSTNLKALGTKASVNPEPKSGATSPVSPSHFLHPKRRPTTIDVPGLTKSKTSPDGTISKEDPGSKLVIVMVGLPATGKSFITNKLSRFLNYSMYYCKVFNVGNTRRQFAKEHGLQEQDSKFFDPSNPESSKLREKWAIDTLDQLLDYLLDGPGSVGIFDATNSTRQRRKRVLDKIHSRNSQIKILFLESICSDRATVEKNIQLKLFGPDYKGKDPSVSLQDFKERLANYLTAYEPIEDNENLQYIKMIDVGKKVISYNIQGFLASQTVYYLLNFNLAERQIWITRNGESEYNVAGRIGGDSHLTARGERYAKALTRFINDQRILFNEKELKNHETTGAHNSHEDGNCEDGENCNLTDFFVWTSMLQRSVETAQFFNEDEYPIKQMRMLDELSAGDCEGLTYAEIQERYPEEFEERLHDKLRYRYPGIGGESYMDVINRLRSVITEVERITDNVLIITHRVVARVLLGYFLNLSRDIIANLDVPLHCVYCLEPKPYGVTWSLYEYDEDADYFFKVPQTELNTTKVKEIGLVHKERRYSIIPTAPPSTTTTATKGDFLTKTASATSLSQIASVNRIGGNVLSNAVGGGTSISSRYSPQVRNQPPYQPHPSILARQLSNSTNNNDSAARRPSPHSPNYQIELDKLNEKLSKLRNNDRNDHNDPKEAHNMRRSHSGI